MPSINLNPYFTRDGDSRAMLEFYHEIFGGKLDTQTYAEAKMPTPDNYKDRLIHGDLQTEALRIMTADATPETPTPSKESNVSLSLTGTDEAALKKIFSALSDGGKVTMPLEKQFWGDTFGMVDDKFGTHWMVNIEAPKSPDKN